MVDNEVDIYVYYFVCAFVIEAVALGVQIYNVGRGFISKKQNIILAVLVGLFQMGSLCVLGIQTGQAFAQFWVLNEECVTE